MLPLASIVQAGGGLIEEALRDHPSTIRGTFQLIGEWLARASEYLQKDEAGLFAEFLFVLLCSVLASTLAFSHKRLSKRRSLGTEDCYVEFLWNDFEVVPKVGEQYEYIVHYPPTKADRGPPEFTISMHNGDIAIPFCVQHDTLNGQARVQFTPRVSGFYTFRLAVEHVPIPGSPFLKRFDPGEPTASHTTVSNFMPVMVTGDRTALQLKLRLRDRYANETFIDDANAARLEKMLRLRVERCDSGKASAVTYSVWRDDVLLNSTTLSVQLPSPGRFRLRLLYDGAPLAKSPRIDVIVVCETRYHALMNYNEEDPTSELNLGESALFSDAQHHQIKCSIRVVPDAGGSGSQVHFIASDKTVAKIAINSSLKVFLRDRTVELANSQGPLRVAVASEHSSLFIYAGLLHLVGRSAGAGKAFEERRDLLAIRVC
ncbi:apoptosis-resistant E3 ubiquitin protein ligase 1-like [Tropilaelaps mercedesae]|uniref:Apoptosis-resistant E3 ubiquitin protein ligase 1-like n=1 Tax=Tropilaelaps mercedesae TaxID=418985 RepID=A0A1V9XSX4_9ACAR|nr:apoptosis-resistant E3 ubiquitin protein ligase 1-like [Tropilaelaps mercedesae]